MRQALEYAFHTGVPFIVLTDGKTWSFYLPAEQGSYEERRVFKLDLFERPVGESADVLQRYLEQGRVASGEALETARREYRSQNRRAVAREAIPEAWSGLVDEGDELLIELLAGFGRVESRNPAPMMLMSSIFSFHCAGRRSARLLRQASAERRPLNHHHYHRRMRRFRFLQVPGLRVADRLSYWARSSATWMPTRRRRSCWANSREKIRPPSAPLSTPEESRHGKRRYVAQSSEELYPDKPDLRNAANNFLTTGSCPRTSTISKRRPFCEPPAESQGWSSDEM